MAERVIELRPGESIALADGTTVMCVASASLDEAIKGGLISQAEAAASLSHKPAPAASSPTRGDPA